MYVLSVQYSCAVVSVFLFGRKANLELLTLFYSTLLALTHRQTDGRTDRQTNTLALRGLEEPAHALRGLEELFLQLCCMLCQFFVLAGNRFWFYMLLMYLGYRTIQFWCCVIFFGSGGKQFLVLRTYLVYNIVVWLCQFFSYGGKQFSK